MKFNRIVHFVKSTLNFFIFLLLKMNYSECLLISSSTSNQNRSTKKYLPWILIFIVLFFLIIFILLILILFKKKKQTSDPYFIFINDLHIDPFYNNFSTPYDSICSNSLRNISFSFGQFGCDPPFSLFLSFLKYSKYAFPTPSFIIIDGDIHSHQFLDRLSKKLYFRIILQQIHFFTQIF